MVIENVEESGRHELEVWISNAPPPAPEQSPEPLNPSQNVRLNIQESFADAEMPNLSGWYGEPIEAGMARGWVVVLAFAEGVRAISSDLFARNTWLDSEAIWQHELEGGGLLTSFAFWIRELHRGLRPQ